MKPPAGINNRTDELRQEWGYWNRLNAQISIRAKGYRLVSMPDVLPAVSSVAELTGHENGALLWLEPRQSFQDLKPPKVALGKDAEAVLRYYRWEFSPREDRPFIAYFRNPLLYGRHFSIIDSQKHIFKECISKASRWKAGVPRKKMEARHVPGTYLQTSSEFHAHYAHHFCDILPRLMLYEQQGLLHKVPALLHASGKSVSEQSYRRLGLDTPDCRYWDETFWKMDGVYFATMPKQFCSWTPESAAWVRGKFHPGLDEKPVGKKRFYISRRNAVRPALNEDEILAAIKPWGITVVEPERLSLQEQVELFSDAGLIMGPHGAGIQNSLWAPRGCKVLEFISPRYFTGLYWTLADSLGHDYGLVTGEMAPGEDPISNGLTIDPKLVAQAVDVLLGSRSVEN
jgi:capsular polysaccharide biosynthesis protein